LGLGLFAFDGLYWIAGSLFTKKKKCPEDFSLRKRLSR
jgi:hypothetical protein